MQADRYVDERHRHRFEVNPTLVEQLEAAGLRFVGKDETGQRMEVWSQRRVCEVLDPGMTEGSAPGGVGAGACCDVAMRQLGRRQSWLQVGRVGLQCESREHCLHVHCSPAIVVGQGLHASCHKGVSAGISCCLSFMVRVSKRWPLRFMLV